MTTLRRGDIPILTLGWRLRLALAHGGTSVQEMADELGVSRTNISRWLHDRSTTPPRAAFLKQWALRTGVDYQWLAGTEVADQGS